MWQAGRMVFASVLCFAASASLAIAQGFVPERLDRLTRFMQERVDGKHIPGTVMLISRNGRLAYSRAIGVRDPATNAPMADDAIFRLYSMTKPLTSVAAMMLVEEGRLSLADPITRYLPELKDLKVAVEKAGADGKDAFDFVPVKRTATIQDLMRHTAGWTAPDVDGPPLQKMYSQRVQKITSSDDFVKRVAQLPLAREPGTRWEYSMSHDVLGVIVERISGKTLDVFMDERIFRPLGMRDTAFWVEPSKHSRIAEPFPADPVSKSALSDFSDPRRRTGFAAGGGDSEYGADILLSTARDYLRFAQMLLNGGTLDGVRILSRKSVQLLTSDHLVKGIERPALFTGETFGWGLLGVLVRNSNGGATTTGSVGDYQWQGYGGTLFIVDPKEKLVAVRMSQAPWSRNPDNRAFRVLLYSALEGP